MLPCTMEETEPWLRCFQGTEKLQIHLVLTLHRCTEAGCHQLQAEHSVIGTTDLQTKVRSEKTLDNALLVVKDKSNVWQQIGG